MSRVLCLDAVGGAAGDMVLAALLDAGVDPAEVERVLTGLGLDGWTMRVHRAMRGSVSATRVCFEPVQLGAPPPGPASDAGHSHSHSHSHSHTDDPGLEPEFPGQPERSWAVIRRLLEQASLPATARDRAIAIFQRLAEAEGRVHDTPTEDVHFHEVGGVDAILDIVGCAVAIDLLGVDDIVCGPLPVGRGWTRCAHGRIPLPAPATLFLMEGWPTEAGVDGIEQVTPTGAAIWTTVGRSAPLPSMTVEQVGYGAGARELSDRPNVVRACVATVHTSSSSPGVEVTVAQIDDMSPEHLAPLFDALFAAGALDATATPVHMKKQRVGLRIEALSRVEHADAVAEAFLRHSTTFGVRQWTTRRTELERWHEPVETPWGAVRVKVGARRGEIFQAAPEYEDVARVARASGTSTLRVHAAAVTAWHRQGATDD